jgi:hypothetical protein
MLRNRFGFGRSRAPATDETAPDGVATNGSGTGDEVASTAAGPRRGVAPAAAAGTATRTGRLVVPRTRGLLAGLIILVLGVWGGIVPFIGPYFHYQFINHQAWHWTTGRLWLDVIPGAVAVIAGLELMRTGNRVSGVFAGWLAAAAGTWFIVGQTVSTLWNHGVSQAGRPLGGTFLRMLEQLGYFYALGAAILFLGAVALGRFAVLSTRGAVPAYGRGRDFSAAEAREPTPVTRREPVAH